MRKVKNWYDEMWNPVTGCLSNCPDCYALKFCKRFRGNVRLNLASEHLKMIDDKHCELDKPFPSKSSDKHFIACPAGTLPTFHRYRLPQLKEVFKSSKNILVSGLGELFADDTPANWKNDVYNTCLSNPQHNYLFLTAFPKNLFRFFNTITEIPNNFWLGISLNPCKSFEEIEEDLEWACKLKLKHPKVHIFYNFEPFNLEVWNFVSSNKKFIRICDWIICGRKREEQEEPDYSVAIEGAETLKIPIFTPTFINFPDDVLTHNKYIREKVFKTGDCDWCDVQFDTRDLISIGSRPNNNVGFRLIGHLCPECYEKFKAMFEVGRKKART